MPHSPKLLPATGSSSTTSEHTTSLKDYDYEVVTEIAKGKTSTVFYIKDHEQQHFALKVLTPGVEAYRVYFYNRELSLINDMQ